MRWFRRQQREDATSPRAIPPMDVALECEAYLAGSYKDLLERRHAAVPAWAWINQLAHCELDELQKFALTWDGDDGPQAYVARLARRTLVTITRGDTTLRQVQRDFLIPLELALALVPSVPEAAITLSNAVTTCLGPDARSSDDTLPGHPS